MFWRLYCCHSQSQQIHLSVSWKKHSLYLLCGMHCILSCMQAYRKLWLSPTTVHSAVSVIAWLLCTVKWLSGHWHSTVSLLRDLQPLHGFIFIKPVEWQKIRTLEFQWQTAVKLHRLMQQQGMLAHVPTWVASSCTVGATWRIRLNDPTASGLKYRTV